MPYVIEFTETARFTHVIEVKEKPTEKQLDKICTAMARASCLDSVIHGIEESGCKAITYPDQEGCWENSDFEYFDCYKEGK